MSPNKKKNKSRRMAASSKMAKLTQAKRATSDSKSEAKTQSLNGKTVPVVAASLDAGSVPSTSSIDTTSQSPASVLTHVSDQTLGNSTGVPNEDGVAEEIHSTHQMGEDIVSNSTVIPDLAISTVVTSQPDDPPPQDHQVRPEPDSQPEEPSPKDQQSKTLSQSQPAKTYANLLKASAELEEIGTPTEHVSGAPFVLIPDENIQAAKEEFKDFLFARFPGDCPTMGRIIGVVNAVWARSGPRIFVHCIGKGTFLLRVTNAKTRETLLSRTYWNIAGLPMFVAPWSPEFNPEEPPLTNAVVPVELRGVPYLLFNSESLGRLATAIGKPVSSAPETERKENFEVAKLFVRVDLTKSLPSKIISGFSNGREVEISVSYPWLPIQCETCKKYGHKMDGCPTVLERSLGRKDKPQGGTNDQNSKDTNSDHTRRRSRSRPSRAREVKHAVGGIPVGPVNKTDPPCNPVVRDSSPRSDTGNTTREGSTKSLNRRDPQKDQEGSQDDDVPLAINTDTSASVEESPFFLVNNRKCGRKTTKSI